MMPFLLDFRKSTNNDCACVPCNVCFLPLPLTTLLNRRKVLKRAKTGEVDQNNQQERGFPGEQNFTNAFQEATAMPLTDKPRPTVATRPKEDATQLPVEHEMAEQQEATPEDQQRRKVNYPDASMRRGGGDNGLRRMS
jgi:hypothetical protein